jgi:hypothetical protein
MKTLKTKLLFIFLIAFTMSSVYGQTFSTFDSFPEKSGSKTIKTDAYIINLKTEKTNEKIIVSGEILDKETKSNLSGVSVTEKGTMNGTITNNDGEFTFETSTNSPILSFSSTGFTSEQVIAPEANNGDKTKDNSSTSLSGLLGANIGEGSIIQPNIMLSQGWKIGRHGVELRILGLQNNRDTVKLVNGLNLIKPEISKINFRITGDFMPFNKVEKLSANAELNIFRQQLNQNNALSHDIQSNDITSMLLKLSGGYRPANGLHFYASGVYYNVFEGVQYYEERFGGNAVKKFWNFELSGQFVFKEGAFDGTFVQALFNFNSDEYKKLLDTKDSGLFLIKIGFNKALIN